MNKTALTGIVYTLAGGIIWALSGRALVMGLISAVALVIYTVKPARLQSRFETPLFLGWGMLIGGIIMCTVIRPWRQHPIVDVVTVSIVAFIILFGTIAGFSLYMTGVKLIGSVKASLIACVEPVASMVLTALIMKVHFTGMDLLGATLIIGTIFILALPDKAG